jgi:hypothetical protein
VVVRRHLRRMERQMADTEWEAKVKGLLKVELKRRYVS